MLRALVLVCACACALGAGEAPPRQYGPTSGHLAVEHRALTPPQPAYRQLYDASYTHPEAALTEGWDGIPAEAILDILPFPKHLVLLVVGAAKWLAAHASLMILGAVLTVGTCTLTPLCHISLESFEQLEALPAEYYRRLERAARALEAGAATWGRRDPA